MLVDFSLTTLDLDSFLVFKSRRKSPWSRRKRKWPLTPHQWRSLSTPEGKLRDGGVGFLKRVRNRVSSFELATIYLFDSSYLWFWLYAFYCRVLIPVFVQKFGSSYSECEFWTKSPLLYFPHVEILNLFLSLSLSMAAMIWIVLVKKEKPWILKKG